MELKKYILKFNLYLGTLSPGLGLSPIEIAFINETKVLSAETLESIYRSQCLVVQHNVNEKFNISTDVRKFILRNNLMLQDSFLDVDQLSLDCPNGTFISLSQPIQSNPYQTTGRLYVGLETVFLINGSINLKNIRDRINSTTVFLVPKEQPQAAVQVDFRNSSNVCGPVTVQPPSSDVDNEVSFFDLNQTVDEQEFARNYTVTVNSPGTYSISGLLQFVLLQKAPNSTSLINATAYTVKYWDQAQFLNYYNVPEVRNVSNEALAVGYTLIAIVSAIQSTLLIITIKHRKKAIMKMSQGNCLIVFLITGILISTSSVLLNPRNNTYCNLKGMFLYVPLQFYISILSGRLWRITSIMGPLLNWGRNQNEGDIINRVQKRVKENVTKIYSSLREKLNCGPSARNSVRVTISNAQLWLMICFLTLPQFLTQIIFLVSNPQEVQIDYNADQTIGRYQCHAGFEEVIDKYYWISMTFLFLGLVLTLIFAGKSSSLPSLFDEAGAVYTSIVVMVIVLLCGISMASFAGDAETRPDSSYLFLVLSVNIIVLVPSCKIMTPKLKLIRSGKDITMNSILLEHRNQLREKSEVKQKPSTPKNGHKASTLNDQESADLVHTMIDTMNFLRFLNQKNLNGIEISPSEWEELGDVVSKLNCILETKNSNNA